MMMAYLMSLVLYLMTLSSDVLDAILSQPSSIIPILSAIALIVLSGLFVLRNMEKSWYWIVSIAMIIAMVCQGMHGHKAPLWSIILRTLHLIGISLWLGALSYLLISVFT